MLQEQHILVLAPDATDAEVIEMQLRKGNVRASVQRIVARDQLQKVLRTSPPDLVIADATTSRVDLSKTIIDARQSIPGTSWIVLTTAATDDIVVGFMKAGASDVITRKSISRLGTSAAGVLAASLSTPVSRVAVPLPPVPQRRTEPAPVSPRPSKTQPDDDWCRLIVEHAGDLIAVLDMQGKRLYNNPACRDVLDDPEALRGTMAVMDVHPDDRERVSDTLRTGFENGSPFRMEYRLMDQNGAVRVFESAGTIVPPADDGQSRAIVISRDVTGRSRWSEVLGEINRTLGGLTGETYFRELAALVAQLLQVRYVLLSECLYHPCERVRTLAYCAGGAQMPSFEYDLAGTTCEGVFATGEPVVFGDNIQKLFPKETALVSMGARSYVGVPLFGTDRRINGHLFLMDDSPMPDASHALSVLTLLAPRAGMEVQRHIETRALRASEARLRSILDSVQDGVLVMDSLGIVTYTNDRFASFAGYTGVRMIGKNIHQFLTIPGVDALEEFATVVDSRGDLRCQAGERVPVAASGSALRDAAGRICGAVLLIRPVASDILNR